MALSDKAIQALKPKGSWSYFVADGINGLYIEVTPKGGKFWRVRFTHQGVRQKNSVGIYPATSLKTARQKALEVRELIEKGIDPKEHRAESERQEKAKAANTFEQVARAWHKHNKLSWKQGAKNADQVLRRLEIDLFPHIGERPIDEINHQELMAVFSKMVERGILETARRNLQVCCRIWAYALVSGLCQFNAASGLVTAGAIPKKKKEHFSAITKPNEIGKLLRAIDAYKGHFVTLAALKLSPYLFLRPSELRTMRWDEVSFEEKLIRLEPGVNRKLKVQHIVPMARQVEGILRELHTLTAHSKYVFPAIGNKERPLSENGVRSALIRIGYGDEMSAHGFRTTASTILNEQGWNADAIERQLSHCERDEVRAAYNKAKHLPERIEMMQSWADYLDGLKARAGLS
jgi:integrase